MKYITTFKLAPGVDNVLRSWEIFQTHGTPANAQAVYAGGDGRTYVAITDGEIDTTLLMTYAPFYDEITVLPIVDVDDAWAGAAAAAVANLGG